MPENVIAVGLILPEFTRGVAEEHLEELVGLVGAAGGNVMDKVLAKRPNPDPATYVGKGKVEEIKALVERHKAKMVVFDDDLSPAQARNLEKIVEVKVIDRSGLILDIFASRARSRESRTQVELAQLQYMLPRLTRAWTHLSRQGGGIGTRGVGETQLETDRRLVRNRISRLKDELGHIERTRHTQRNGRKGVFTIALVGYTNAGKSTLFNQLTRGGAEAVDKLFATLDSKLQKTSFDMPRETVVIDTVGFIRKLPHNLVASFRSTMEEAVSADVVLHVINAAHPQFEEQREVGEDVLRDLGVSLDNVVEVYNKIDQLDGALIPGSKRPNCVAVSATTGEGMPQLIELLRARELAGGALLRLEIPHDQSRLVAKLHEVAEVYEQEPNDDGIAFSAWIPNDALHIFAAYATMPHPPKPA
jgi:GTP-binding protein HflX